MKNLFKGLLILAFFTILGCSSTLPRSGPSTSEILSDASKEESIFTLIELSSKHIFKLKKDREDTLKNDLKFFSAGKFSPVLGIGDLIEIIVYEQPPSVLFSQSSLTPYSSQSGLVSFQIPTQPIDDLGYINIPLIGRIHVKDKRPEEVAKYIEKTLSNMANKPHALVRVVDYRSGKINLSGHLKENKSLALNYNISNLIDAISAAGGVTSPINKTIIRINRKERILELPYESIIKNPSFNVNLLPGDIVTAIHKNQSATFLGASGKNEELEFEATGITLAQSLGRVGGLQDDKAHAKGLFIFRFEELDTLKQLDVNPKYATDKGYIPVVYNIDMTKSESFYLIREFEIKDKDIVYISTAPSVQIRKFLQLISEIISPIFQIRLLSNLEE